MDGGRNGERCGLRFGLWCALALSVLASPYLRASRAHAQASLDFALNVQAPSEASCVSVSALREAIELRVGGLVFTDDPRAARRIEVSVASELDASEEVVAWTATIAMRDAREAVVGERSVRAEDTQCSGLDEALILVLTTMIGIADETKQAKATEPEPEATPPKDQTAEPTLEVAIDPPIDEDSTETPLHLDLMASLSARADLGLLPGIAPGGSIAATFDFGTVAIVLGGSWLPYATEDLGFGAQAHFMSVLGELGVCVEAAQPLGAQLDFCASGQAGTIATRTTGLHASAQRFDPLVRALIGTRLRIGFSDSVGLLAGLDAAAPIVFSRYFFIEADGERRYFHTVELGIAGQLGLYWLFSS